MKKVFKIVFVFLMTAVLSSCDSTQNIDDEKPVVDLTIEGARPVNCDTLFFGESFTFRALLKDNVELGSYSISVHHNFDHHSHTTEVSACELAPQKDPVNPLIFIQDFSIPAGMNEYETGEVITLPQGNENGNFDPGDYHFFISLTDKEGWSAQKGLSIKILKR